jgi:ribosomal protein L40E
MVIAMLNKANISRKLLDNAPTESIGLCSICGFIKVLGNGLCKGCWDKHANYIIPAESNIITCRECSRPQAVNPYRVTHCRRCESLLNGVK